MRTLDVDLTGQPNGRARSRIGRDTLDGISDEPARITFAIDPIAGSANVATMVRGALARTGQPHSPIQTGGGQVVVTVNPEEAVNPLLPTFDSRADAAAVLGVPEDIPLNDLRRHKRALDMFPALGPRHREQYAAAHLLRTHPDRTPTATPKDPT